MSYSLTEVTFHSKNETDNIHGYIYEPKDTEIRGIVQLSHGMIDYVGRYEALAEYMTEHGYVFAGNDHVGHGKSAKRPEDLGYFPGKSGANYLVRDLHTMNKILRERYPGTPIILLGHSMGSFLSRLYVEKYPHSIQGHIIHGTSGPVGAVTLGKAVVGIISAFRGERHRSMILTKLSFSGYNSKFPASEGNNAWLTRDVERVSNRDSDPLTSFIFTTSGYRTLYGVVGECNSKRWYKSYPKNMPTLIMSGDMDPVGQYGKGPQYVYKHLLLEGCTAVKRKIYEGARHELFNETCRDEAFADILAFTETLTG